MSSENSSRLFDCYRRQHILRAQFHEVQSKGLMSQTVWEEERNRQQQGCVKERATIWVTVEVKKTDLETGHMTFMKYTRPSATSGREDEEDDEKNFQPKVAPKNVNSHVESANEPIQIDLEQIC